MSKDMGIGPGTKVQLTTVISMLIATVWITGELRGIRNELTTQRSLVGTKISSIDIKLWMARLKAENPTLKLPDFDALVRAREDDESRNH